MEDIPAKIRELEKEITKIKVFCGFVVATHDHLPQLKRIWNEPAGSLVYLPNTSRSDLAEVKIGFMKRVMKLEDRIIQLEAGLGISHEATDEF
ncbi:MAG: hypothetical protein PHH77_13180 [Victivallaceae bacterium]|nr:hypothetical protein [Victivallaceae bacterium]